jgi:3-deoxy-D-manno-octulosonic acid kinase
MTAELVAYGLAITGGLALVASLLHHLRAERRQAVEHAERAKREREQFHSLAAMMEEIGAVVTGVDSEAGPAVIKHYRRGGAMAHLSREAYLWMGERQVRSVREYALLRTMRELDLPVPLPLAAGWHREGIHYRCALITQRLPGVESFVAIVAARGNGAPWTAVGATLARFHARGLRHADLNAHNVLIGANDEVHVIDWDKGRVELVGGGWPGRVLDRLERSLRKQLPQLDDAVLADGMARLRAAHVQGLAP